MITEKAIAIFKSVIDTYHVINTVDQNYSNPYDREESLLDFLLQY